jgi:hypothetical protein
MSEAFLKEMQLLPLYDHAASSGDLLRLEELDAQIYIIIITNNNDGSHLTAS